jgi:hypothetical protein
VRGLDDKLEAQARAWARKTALAQGLPAKVEDHDVLRSVATLLGLNGAAGLVAPDGGQAGGVEAVVPSPAGADDDVLQ